MIPLTLAHAIALYATALAATLLLLSAARTILRLRREKRDRRRHIQCALCGTIYESSSPDPIPPCPTCAHPNERTVPLGP